jgi:hypothetical protein
MTHVPGDEFDHPFFDSGHPLRRHVLYRIARCLPQGTDAQHKPGESWQSGRRDGKIARVEARPLMWDSLRPFSEHGEYL